MQLADRKLLREIVVVVVLKLVLITALWWAFIRGHQVEVDVQRMVAHTSGTSAGGLPNPDGETDGHRATR
ncbi:cytochrome oxidase putative small subunit CydP [Thauera butanivorans]|uniref:cytochrome oxidase putative small subunit CydP n=1 Tax=Thauera butanivorans TaxID=86174 RepID=UPI000838E3A7|nr:cytochrome oxidase putative small subunit CydP [Thauera butanivorans]